MVNDNIETKFVAASMTILILYSVPQAAHWWYKDQIPQQSTLIVDHKYEWICTCGFNHISYFVEFPTALSIYSVYSWVFQMPPV